jgi:two-component sensor histidine kinase/PAS domain-containing protein
MPTTKDSVGASSADGAVASAPILRVAAPDEQLNDTVAEAPGAESCAVVDLRDAMRARGAGAPGKTPTGTATGPRASTEARKTANHNSRATRAARPLASKQLPHSVVAFAELERKLRELEQRNSQLERHMSAEMAAHAAELEAAQARLIKAEQGRSLALIAGQMGSWDWDIAADAWTWDDGTYRIFGVDPKIFKTGARGLRAMVHPSDWPGLQRARRQMTAGALAQQCEFRVIRPSGEIRWCIGTAAASTDAAGRVIRASGVLIDITERKEAEHRQVLLAREVDHRARNALAVIQSIIRLTRAKSIDDYVTAIEGRIKALARAHTLLSDSHWNDADLATLVADELAPYRTGDRIQHEGPGVSLPPATAQGLALALHELATNASKHGALSSPSGTVKLEWALEPDALIVTWLESGGPRIALPSARNFGLKVIVASIEQQLGGRATFDWDPRGLRCLFSIPRRFSGVPVLQKPIEPESPQRIFAKDDRRAVARA